MFSSVQIFNLSSKFVKWILFLQCSVSCGTGTQARKVFCKSKGKKGKKHPDEMCSGPKPSIVRPCKRSLCPQDSNFEWHLSSWGPVSNYHHIWSYKHDHIKIFILGRVLRISLIMGLLVPSFKSKFNVMFTWSELGVLHVCLFSSLWSYKH